MNRARIKRIYNLHSWLGLIAGLFLFIICLSGTIAVFGEEIKTWSSPELRHAITQNESTLNLQTPLNKAIISLPKNAKINTIRLVMPTQKTPYLESFIAFEEQNKTKNSLLQRWHTTTLQLLPVVDKDPSHWLINIHRYFMLSNRRIGLAIVGFFGIVMLLLTLTGLLIHNKIIADLFKWNLLQKSLKTRFRTSHNILAIWGLPFHIMIAFTGAFLGIVAILTPISGLIIFKGDKEALTKILLKQPLPPSGIYAPMYPLESAKKNVQETTGNKVRMIIIHNWQDTKASYEFLLHTPHKLSRGSQVKVNAITGEINSIIKQKNNPISLNIISAISPLHYGTYSGIWLKFLYVFLGLVSSMLVATGLALWLQKRQYKHKLLEGTFIGISSGLLIASIGMLYIDRLWKFPLDERLYYNGISYFSLWFLSLIYALIRHNTRQANRQLLAIAGILLLMIPLFDWMLTGKSLYRLIQQAHFYSAGVNIAGFIFGSVLLYVVYLLSRQHHHFKKDF